MQESFLHFLWRWRRFDANALLSTEGLPLEILHPGDYNRHAGPDFFNARIRIGQTTWAGNVELHVHASEWRNHGHHDDPAYDNVILHVVAFEDQPIFRSNGERIPCLELHSRIPSKILQQYKQLEATRNWIPCQQLFPEVPSLITINWLDRMLVERLEQKTTVVMQLLRDTGNHWEAAFYQYLAHYFGLKVNTAPFETLARILPLQVLAKHRHQPFQLEALVFGQAGILAAAYQDEYPQSLIKEYAFLRHKYQLAPMTASQWKFLRLRPANFPTIRLAQFARLMQHSSQLFAQILATENLRELEQLFDIHLDGYWLDHYLFDKPSTKRPKNLGRDFIHLLIINAVVPFLFCWGRSANKPHYEDYALRLLEQLPPESNALVNQWEQLGIKAGSAYQSQALVHLKTQCCDQKRCLDCAIGLAILK